MSCCNCECEECERERLECALDRNEVVYGPPLPPTAVELAVIAAWKPYILEQFRRNNELMDYLRR